MSSATLSLRRLPALLLFSLGDQQDVHHSAEHVAISLKQTITAIEYSLPQCVFHRFGRNSCLLRCIRWHKISLSLVVNETQSII